MRGRPSFSAPGDIACDVLKVPYHGRAVDVSAAFLSACHPKIAFITDSDDDPADPIVVKLLESMGTDVHSARDGDLCVVSDGKKRQGQMTLFRLSR